MKFSQFSIARVRSSGTYGKLEDITITVSIYFDELNKLKTDKSPGPEGWPLCTFKECSEQLSIPLSIFQLFNKSFQSDVLPSEWRAFNLLPLFIMEEVNVLLITTDLSV